MGKGENRCEKFKYNWHSGWQQKKTGSRFRVKHSNPNLLLLALILILNPQAVKRVDEYESRGSIACYMSPLTVSDSSSARVAEDMTADSVPRQ